jgi:hypothetical protein
LTLRVARAVRASAASGVVLVVLSGIGVASAAAPTTTTIAGLHGNTGIETYGDVQAWSDYDATDRSWHVVVRRNGQLSMPAIAAASKAIEVDVGPGPTGAPVLAYASCSSTCHVVVSGVDGSAPESVPGSENASHPTVWGDRVAWVSGRAKVITSLIDGTQRKVIGGAPKRKCYEAPSGRARLICTAPEEPAVEALELHGGQLALIDTFLLINDGVGASGTTTEVRTEAVTGGRQHLVAILTVGEGDESWIGPSWVNGKLYFYEDSGVGGDGQTAAFGFDPTHDTYVRASASTYLTGFSMTKGRQAYEATAPADQREGSTGCEEEGTNQCMVQLSAPFHFKPVPARTLVFAP